MYVSTVKSFHISTNAVQAVSSSNAILVGYYLDNTANSAITFYQFFALAAASVILGTTVPAFVIPIPGLGAANVMLQSSMAALSFAVTTTYNGSTAPASAVDATIWYA